jgi:hypothetical protein
MVYGLVLLIISKVSPELKDKVGVTR